MVSRPESHSDLTLATVSKNSAIIGKVNFLSFVKLQDLVKLDTGDILRNLMESVKVAQSNWAWLTYCN